MTAVHSTTLFRRALVISIAIHLAVGGLLHRTWLAPTAVPAPERLSVKLTPPEPLPQRLPPPPPPAPPPTPRPAPRQPAKTPPPPAPTPPVLAVPATEAPAASFTVPAVPPTPPVTASPPAATASAPPATTPPQFGAAYLSNPPPDYPLSARRRQLQGTTYLEVHVGRDGHPQSVSVGRSSGYPVLDDAAVSAVRGWTFVPARRGNEVVEGVVEVPIRFRLEG